MAAIRVHALNFWLSGQVGDLEPELLVAGCLHGGISGADDVTQVAEADDEGADVVFGEPTGSRTADCSTSRACRASGAQPGPSASRTTGAAGSCPYPPPAEILAISVVTVHRSLVASCRTLWDQTALLAQLQIDPTDLTAR